MNDKLDYVREQLEQYRMVDVAKESDISVRTLSNIKNGKSVRSATLKVLHAYFKRREPK